MKTSAKNLLLLLALLQAAGQAEAYYVDHGRIRDNAGQPVQLRGVNWFGFETGDHVAHGLWARNWQDMIAQMKSVGFNAVRVPVCPGTLAGVGVGSVNGALNPDLSGKNSLQVLDAVLGEFDRQGFYILLDHHRLDCNSGISELWYDAAYSEQRWIGDLAFMAGRYKNLPHFLGLDLKNEPHGAATWGVGNIATDWNAAAERAATAVLSVAPDALVFVEGIENNPSCSGPFNHWWGGNLEPLACHPLAIPADHLVLSPHVYGPDVYNQPYFSAADFPNNLPAIWEAHFGRFKDAGYAVAIGETGGRYGHGGSAKDKLFQDALVGYLGGKGITDVFYWSWNPNSGDTGGILQDDWKTVWQDKLDLLGRLWQGTPQAPACSDGLDNDADGLTDHPADPGCAGPEDGNEAADQSPLPVACGDGFDNDGDGRVDYPNDPGCASSADTDETDPVQPPTEQTLPAKVTVSSDWGTGYCAEVAVANTLAGPVKWRTAFTAQGGINNLWNAAHTQTGDQVAATGLGWNGTLAPGASAQFGFCADRPEPKAACADGLDNDGDGRADYPADPGCASAADTDEADPADPVPGGLVTVKTIQSDWGAGYCADVTVKNPGEAAVVWQVSLNVEGRINNLWNAAHSQSGATLTAKGLDWNRSVPAGGSVGFGFCAVR
ncbi:cellulase family glycosylhydrolase [Methylomagnum sp.]